MKKQDKLKKVIAVVYRTNKTGTSLLNSKPCLHCLMKTYYHTRKKNFLIDRFYYFNEKSELCFYNQQKIKELVLSKEKNIYI